MNLKGTFLSQGPAILIFGSIKYILCIIFLLCETSVSLDPRGGEVLPYKRLMGMCRWMG